MLQCYFHKNRFHNSIRRCLLHNHSQIIQTNILKSKDLYLVDQISHHIKTVNCFDRHTKCIINFRLNSLLRICISVMVDQYMKFQYRI